VLRKVLVSLVFCFLVPVLPSLSSLLAAEGQAPSGQFRSWLEEVNPLITPREREAFLSLAADADREAFVRRFWEVRDPYPETPRNEAKERWDTRLAEARQRWGGTRDDRARVFLLKGEPDSIFPGTCDGTALELWTYEPGFQVQYRIVLAFLSGPAGGPSQLWRPGTGPDLVAASRARKCEGDPRADKAFTWLREAGTAGCDIVAQRALAAPKPPEWVSTFHPATAVLNRGDSAPPPEIRRLFAEADADLAASRPGLRIEAPSGVLLAGMQRFEARVERAAGVPEEARIERVAFSLDGKPILTRNRPPFVVEVDLGRVPRAHKITAQGLDRAGKELASDELAINAGAQRFAVHLVEPRPGRSYHRSLRARVNLDVPEDRGVDRVELYLGDDRVATLYQPPFILPLALPDPAVVSYVRAVAYLSDGTSAEDVVLLNAPAPAETMSIRLVELYASAGDRAGRLFDSLGAGDFQVFEDGARQTLRQVERVDDTPLRLVALMDNSASMQPRLAAVSRTAVEFLRQTLHPKDQAAVITFNKAPRVAVGLTGDLSALAAGFDGLMADDETSLWDSIIFSLCYLGGTSGQRAVVVLSDGEDRTSRFHFDDALESARRAGIAVFVLGINLTRGEATERLSRLAKDTGGRSFFVKSTDDLPAVYSMIEKDLRSRYRITYQSSNTRPGEAFRTVRVQVDKPGVEARTISGYYP